MQLDELPVRGRNRQLPTTLARADARGIIQLTRMVVKSDAREQASDRTVAVANWLA